ncbi:hypothetical protein [Labilibaculum manganireducens]|uniref:fibronectin type III domain-containing protein n=1 Tax=Labilibaculum manganireducens TaxID=1940525 RepID=UPI0029F56806|nr:hypothetical protein [Labilibaculum manganireducens]
MNYIYSKIKIVARLLVFLAFLSSSATIYGQEEEKHEIKLLTRAMQDSILLRWGPTTYPLWLYGNKVGYKITRTLLVRDNDYVAKPKVVLLTPTPLKPLPLREWELLAESDDYAGVAAQAIYGDDFEVEANNGSPSMIDIVNKAKVQESRFGFALFSADQSSKVAEYSGLFFNDKNVMMGEKYLYKVFLAQAPEGMKVDTAYFFTGIDEYMPLPAPLNVKAEEGDKMVTITWDKKYQEDFYNSFWVEKSMDNGKIYIKVNDTPLVNTTPDGYAESDFGFVIDTLVDNYHTYLYRVIGISVFGELSPPSEVVEVKGKNTITSVPLVHLSKTEDGTGVTIKWEFPDDKGEIVDGFRIFRSDKFAKDYQLLVDSLSLIQTSYTDKHALLTGYYRMQAYNSDGSGPYSIPKMEQLVDSIPPAIPLGLKAVADTTGLVRLTWSPNKDDDIFGYRVYRANSKKEEFSQLTSKAIKNPFYKDQISLKTLTKEVYYKIVAVDNRQNQSAFSEILELERPDIVPPASPFIKSIKSVDSGLEISWIRSASNDVVKQVVYRNTSGSREWELIKTESDTTTHFTDGRVLPDGIYKYILLAVDKAGNESKTIKPVAGKFIGNKLNDLWIVPHVKRDKKTKEFILTWIPPVYEVERYMIYYKNSKGIWRLLDGVDSRSLNYTTKVEGMEFKVFCKIK